MGAVLHLVRTAPICFFVCLHIMLSRTTLMRLWNIRVVYVVSTEFFAQ